MINVERCANDYFGIGHIDYLDKDKLQPPMAYQGIAEASLLDANRIEQATSWDGHILHRSLSRQSSIYLSTKQPGHKPTCAD